MEQQSFETWRAAVDSVMHPRSAAESDTSRAAANSMRESAARIRERVRRAVASQGHYGATCDELEALLDMRHQTCSARVHELAKLGAIIDSGERRPTRSGRKAAVYRAA